MESRIQLFGHALHPILIVFPLGLLADAVFESGGARRDSWVDDHCIKNGAFAYLGFSHSVECAVVQR